MTRKMLKYVVEVEDDISPANGTVRTLQGTYVHSTTVMKALCIICASGALIQAPHR